MSVSLPGSPLARLIDTLHLVHREGRQLAWSRERLAGETLDEAWAVGLADRPEAAERLEAFVSRFARMQDTVGEKLLPRWLVTQAEFPGSMLDMLNRAERLGLIASATAWIAARKLRKRLIHEYMTDPSEFAQHVRTAIDFVPVLLETYNAFLRQVPAAPSGDTATLPPELTAGAHTTRPTPRNPPGEMGTTISPPDSGLAKT